MKASISNIQYAAVDSGLSWNMERKPQEHVSLFHEEWLKKCWMRDCIELQKLVEQRLATTMCEDLGSL